MYYCHITDIRLRINKDTNLPYFTKRINRWQEEMLSETDEEHILITIRSCHVTRLHDGRLLLKNKRDENIQIIMTIEDEALLCNHYGMYFKVDSYQPSRPKA